MEVESTYAIPVGVKLTHGNEMRRFQFNGGSFNAFQAQVVSILGLEANTEVLLKYTDEENDLITLSSDLELRSAIVPNQLLRVVVNPRNPSNHTVVAPPVHFQAPVASSPDVQFFPQFYQPGQQQPAGERWARKMDAQQDKDAKKEKKESEKMEKRQRKMEEKIEKKARKMLKKKLEHSHSPHAHHPYQHPHHGPHGHGHGPHGHGPHSPRHGPHGHDHHHGHGHEEKHGKFVARFVADVATPDGTVIPPNTPFVKTWRLRNEGAAWPADCGVFFIGRLSDRLGAPAFLPLGEMVAPHQEINVSVPLVAPETPGRYTAYFRMCTADGVKFGQRVWVSIVVPAPDSSSEGEKEADKYEELVDVVLRNEVFRTMGVKRHWVFRQLQKHDGDVEKVVNVMTKKAEKKMKKHSKK